MQNPPFSPQVWLFPSHLFTQFSHEFNTIMMIDNLATGIPPCHHNTLDIEENNQHGLELRTILPNFFAFGEFSDFQFIDYRFVSGSYVNIQSLITSNYRFQQSRFLLSALQKVRKDYVSKLLLFSR